VLVLQNICSTIPEGFMMKNLGGIGLNQSEHGKIGWWTEAKRMYWYLHIIYCATWKM